jgi:MFS family permease
MRAGENRAGLGGRPVGRTWAFWGVAYAFLVTMMGTTLPTPLYGLYEVRFDFAAGMLTVIFATYAGGVLIALVLFGALSDRVGRRPVLAGAVGLGAVSTVLFLIAQDVTLLLAGRLFSGLAAGLVTSAATATLTDLEPQGDTQRASLVSTAVSILGLGLGPVFAGVLADFGPRPIRLPFLVYLVMLVPAFAVVRAMPETVPAAAAGPRWRPRWPAVPRQLRAVFVVAAAAVFVGFALLGLFTSLAPTFASQDLGIENRAVAGAIVFAVFGASGAAQIALKGMRDRLAMHGGFLLIPLGLLLIVLALHQRSLMLFLAGALVGGFGQGLGFLGSLAMINRLAPAAQRAATLSSYFVVAYLAISIPVVALGFGAQIFGLYDAALAYAIAIGALAVASLVTSLVRAGAGQACSKTTRDAGNHWRSC